MPHSVFIILPVGGPVEKSREPVLVADSISRVSHVHAPLNAANAVNERGAAYRVVLRKGSSRLLFFHRARVPADRRDHFIPLSPTSTGHRLARSLAPPHRPGHFTPSGYLSFSMSFFFQLFFRLIVAYCSWTRPTFFISLAYDTGAASFLFPMNGLRFLIAGFLLASLLNGRADFDERSQLPYPDRRETLHRPHTSPARWYEHRLTVSSDNRS